MSPQQVTHKLGSVFARYLHVFRAYRAVTRLLKKLMKINGYFSEDQMMEAVM
jgi:hypothetical protein